MNDASLAAFFMQTEPYGLLHGDVPKSHGHFLLPYVNENHGDVREQCGLVGKYVSY
jgi:hypothetical protein